MSRLWDLYKRPEKQAEGEIVEGIKGLNGEPARYFNFDKFYGVFDSRSQGFYTHMAIAYGIGLVTYAWATKYSKFQRWSSAAILTAVPLVIMLGRKGEDHLIWETRPKTLQEKLEFYPMTRRALERAIKDYDAETNKS